MATKSMRHFTGRVRNALGVGKGASRGATSWLSYKLRTFLDGKGCCVQISRNALEVALEFCYMQKVDPNALAGNVEELILAAGYLGIDSLHDACSQVCHTAW